MKDWPSGFGIITPGNLRLSYGLPENAGMSSEILERKIDSIANAGLMLKLIRDVRLWLQGKE